MTDKAKVPQTLEEARAYMREHDNRLAIGDIVDELNKCAGALYVGPLPEYRGHLQKCRAKALENFATLISDAKIITIDVDMVAQLPVRDTECNFLYVDCGFRYAPGHESEKPVDKEIDPL